MGGVPHDPHRGGDGRATEGGRSPDRRNAQRHGRDGNVDPMLGEPPNEGALSRDLSERGCVPSLPPGYQAQPAWGFHDRTGRLSYEFSYVYGPPDRLDKRGPI